VTQTLETAITTTPAQTIGQMRVTCNRLSLFDAVTRASKVAGLRHPKRILGGVQLIAQGAILVVIATDLETAIRIEDRQVLVDQEGQILLPVEPLLACLAAIPDDVVTIETGGVSKEETALSFSNGRYELLPIAGDEFPAFPDLPDQHFEASILARDLLALIHQTAFCAAREETRYAFNGVQFSAKEGRMTAVSTDGRRLAMISRPCVHLDDDAAEIIIYVRALRAMKSVLREICNGPYLDERVSLRIEKPKEVKRASKTEKADGGRVFLVTRGCMIAAHGACGEYPPYQSVIPKESDRKTRITVKRKTLVAAVEQARAMISMESKGLRFDCNGGVRLTQRNCAFGRLDMELECQLEGEPMDIAFNPEFLADYLKRCSESDIEEIVIDLSAPNRPALIYTNTDPSTRASYVLMPVNMNP
jgi:DNA polymerase-3 subunit beta